MVEGMIVTVRPSGEFRLNLCLSGLPQIVVLHEFVVQFSSSFVVA